MPIPKDQLKTAVLEVVCPAIRSFIDSHAGERFYAFAFDCSSDYGDILACFSTEAHLEECLRKAANSGRSPWTPSEERAMYRWNTGDWAYQGFFACHEAPAVAEICQSIEEELEVPDCREQFLEAISLAAHELQASGIFGGVSTHDFVAFAIDHEEAFEHAFARMEKLSKSKNRE